MRKQRFWRVFQHAVLDVARRVVRVERGGIEGVGLAHDLNGRVGFFEGGHLFMLEDGRAWPAMTEFLTA